MIVVVALLAFLAGAVLGAIGYRWWRSRPTEGKVTNLVLANAPRVIEWMRRAHSAQATCLVAREIDPIWAKVNPEPPVRLLERTASAARLALGDGREHVLPEGDEPVIVAAGDGQLGCAVALGSSRPEPERVDDVTRDLRRLLADFRGQRTRVSGVWEARRHLPEWLTGGPESVDGIAFHLCDAVRNLSGRPAALVMRDPNSHVATVTAVSASADRRLLGVRVTPNAAAGRACVSDVPIVSPNLEEMFGQVRVDRRQRSEQGIAYPVKDGRERVGALVVFGPPESLDGSVRNQIIWLVANTGPKLGRAQAIRLAEQWAMTDELTGLPNRRQLERAMRQYPGGSCGLLAVDLDHFKKLNDTHGHAAGDAALRHIGSVFRRTVREGDLPARIGGEEFAVWLPETTLGKALEVGERIRSAVRESLLQWGGSEVRLTCSVGVAAVPETVGSVDDLLAVADAAMYRAKAAGRDRVEAGKSG